jgi:hypothetical protein
MSQAQTIPPEAPANGKAPTTPPLDETIARRLEELRAEFTAGEERLQELEAERARVRDTVLRIQGAIMALEELGGAGDA